MKNCIALTFLSSILIACGGGSGESSSDSSSSLAGTADSGDAISLSAEAEPQEEEQVVESTSDLVVDSGFLFSTSYAVDLDVDVSQRIDENTYLLVCANFEQGSEGFDVDYSDCIVRVNMSDGNYQSSMLLPNHVQTLVSAIWRFDEDVEPEVTLWDRAVHGDTLRLR